MATALVREKSSITRNLPELSASFTNSSLCWRMKLAGIILPEIHSIWSCLKAIFNEVNTWNRNPSKNQTHILSPFMLLFKACLHQRYREEGTILSPGTTESVLVYWVAGMWNQSSDKNDELQVRVIFK